MLTEDYVDCHKQGVVETCREWRESVGAIYDEYGRLLTKVKWLDKQERRRLMQLSCMLHSRNDGSSVDPDLNSVATDMWAARLWGCRGLYDLLLKERPSNWRWRAFHEMAGDEWRKSLLQCACLTEREWGGESPVSRTFTAIRNEEQKGMFTNGFTASTIAHCLHTTNLEFMAIHLPQFRSVANAFLSMPLLEFGRCRLLTFATHLINFVDRWEQASNKNCGTVGEQRLQRFAAHHDNLTYTEYADKYFDLGDGTTPVVSDFFVANHYAHINDENCQRLLSSGLAVKPTAEEKRAVYAMIATVMPYCFSLTDDSPFHANYQFASTNKSKRMPKKLLAVPAAPWKYLVSIARAFVHAYTECLAVTVKTTSDHPGALFHDKLSSWRKFRQEAFTTCAVDPRKGMGPQFIESGLNTAMACGWFGAADKVLVDCGGSHYTHTVFSMCRDIPQEIVYSRFDSTTMWRRALWGYTNIVWQLYAYDEPAQFTSMAGTRNGSAALVTKWQRLSFVISQFMQDWQNQFTPTMFVPSRLGVFY